MEFTVELMPEGALTSYRPTVYVTHIATLASKSRSHKEYLMRTDNIIVLDHFFNLTNKSNLIGRL